MLWYGKAMKVETLFGMVTTRILLMGVWIYIYIYIYIVVF